MMIEDDHVVMSIAQPLLDHGHLTEGARVDHDHQILVGRRHLLFGIEPRRLARNGSHGGRDRTHQQDVDLDRRLERTLEGQNRSHRITIWLGMGGDDDPLR